jgi:hypothetical protein
LFAFLHLPKQLWRNFLAQSKVLLDFDCGELVSMYPLVVFDVRVVLWSGGLVFSSSYTTLEVPRLSLHTTHATVTICPASLSIVSSSCAIEAVSCLTGRTVFM